MVRITNEDNFDGNHFSFKISSADCIDFSISASSQSNRSISAVFINSTSAKSFSLESLREIL